MAFLGRWATDLVMILVVLIWALNNVVMKVGLIGWVTPGAFNTVRFALGALLLSGTVLALEGSLRLPRDLLPKAALLGLVGNGLNQTLFINGLARAPVSNAGVWLAFMPIIVSFLSAALGLEQVTLRIWLGTLVSVGGLLTVLGAKGAGLSLGWGDVLLLGGITAWSGYTVFARSLVQHASPLRVTAVSMLFAAAGLLVVNGPALLRQDFAAVPPGSWLAILYASALSNGVAYAGYLWSVRRIGAARTSLFNNLGPVLTALGAWLFLGEVWGPMQWFGILLVITGVAVARWDDLRRALSTP